MPFSVKGNMIRMKESYVFLPTNDLQHQYTEAKYQTLKKLTPSLAYSGAMEPFQIVKILKYVNRVNKEEADI